MKANAKVLEVGLLISGESDNGTPWEKQQVVVETLELEPQQLAIDFMGERRTKTTKTLKTGDEVTVSFGIRCRKWADKWFTNLEGYGIQLTKKLDAGEGQEGKEPPAGPELPPDAENEKMF